MADEQNKDIRSRTIQAKMPDPYSIIGAILGPSYHRFTNKVGEYTTPDITRFLNQAPQAIGVIGGRPGALPGMRPPANVAEQLSRANAIGNWFTRAGVNYSTERSRSGSGTVYLHATHPITDERVTVRFPPEGHMGHASPDRLGPRTQERNRYTSTPGNRYDTGTVPHDTKPEQPQFTRNISGELYGSDQNTLLDALRYRLSTAPPGENWLIPQGREPQMSPTPPPVPMTRIPTAYGLGGVVRNTPPETFLNPRRRISLARRPTQLELPFDQNE